jgi:hypothetical protein
MGINMIKLYAFLFLLTISTVDISAVEKPRGQKRKRTEEAVDAGEPGKKVRFSEEVTYFPVRPEEAEGLLDYIEQKKSHISYITSMEERWRVERLQEALRAKNSAKRKEQKRIRNALSTRVQDSLAIWLVRARLRIIDGQKQYDGM